MALSKPYTAEFFLEHRNSSRDSAQEIVPIVLDMIECKRVVDVGCGDGCWLRVFLDCGVEEVLGLDGDYVDRSLLQIPLTQFINCDLQKPPCIHETYDLVVSLEVAEHLPLEAADAFIDFLTGLGPVVLFSAAVPLQGGTFHLNEQWPEFWAEKFQERGYVPIDCIRNRVWQNNSVQWWYAQNTIVFASGDSLESNRRLAKERQLTDTRRLSVVHPRAYVLAKTQLLNLKEAHEPENTSLKNALWHLAGVIKCFIKRRIFRSARNTIKPTQPL